MKRSKIPDFDTATPAKGGGMSKDPLRSELYNDPTHFYSPIELMSVPWVAGHAGDCKFSSILGKFCYSSTNFMLLGMVLAQATGVDSWAELNQMAFLPKSLQKKIIFANSGSPKDAGTVPGYDRTDYNRAPGSFFLLFDGLIRFRQSEQPQQLGGAVLKRLSLETRFEGLSL